MDFGFSVVVFLVIISTLLGGLLGKLIYDYYLRKEGKDIDSRIEKAQEQSEKIIEKAQEQSEKIIEKANNKADSIRDKAEFDATKMINDTQKESTSLLEKINNQKDEIYAKEKELNSLIEKENKKLYEISRLKEKEAKEIVFESIKKAYHQDFYGYIEKFKKQTIETAKQQANDLIAKSIYRVAIENSNHFLVEIVELPSEDYKGKIIGREGRNVQFFERIAGVDISMDDTPEIVKISSFEPEKRFLAKITMQRLIKDGRISPVYIEKVYNKTVAELPEILQSIGRETLIELGIPMMQPEILEYIGKFELRYSYGQNLLSHSKEVAKISEILANELGYDGMLAKKAGLLHDIGKIDVNSGESHAKVGADILRKYGAHEIVINAAESHHFEVEQIHPISWIVAAADAISAGREGVRNNNKEKFIERMSSLESLVLNIEGIKKAYIMQAGREIWTFIDEKKVNDLEVCALNKQVKDKIEQNLDYPGVIKIISIRENKVIDYVG